MSTKGQDRTSGLANGQSVSRAPGCADEPIRIPGSVQQHGFFLALDQDLPNAQDVQNARIVIASENAERFLGLPLHHILGAPLSTVLPHEAVRAVADSPAIEATQTVTQYLGAFPIRNEIFSVVSHRIGNRRILELELQKKLLGAEMMNAVITNFAGTLSKVKTTQEVCHSIVQQVAGLTGFDRVMLYRFDDEGAGTVLEEVSNGKLRSYLGLRFPGTDIPKQARELYILNTVRIIPDVNYVPSALVGLEGEQAKTLDLSLSTLRSVSPVHLQYMRNMGTISSMSLSILVEGKLWGLVSGHHATPHHVPYLVRSACDMLAKLTGTQLTSYNTAERLERAITLHSVQRELLTRIVTGKNYIDSLIAHLDDLRRIANSGGAALVLDGVVMKSGITPSDHDLIGICDWLAQTGVNGVYSTPQLSTDLPWAERIRETASGLIAASISDVNSRWVLWTRPEIIQTVEWAGNPTSHDSTATALTPRHSFEKWKQTVRGHSAPWAEVEIESASEFRSALVTVSLRRAEEEAEINEARFNQLTQTLPTKIFTCDDSGALTYSNSRWIEGGQTRQGIWFENGNVDAEDLPRVREAWHRAVASGVDFQEELRLCDHHQGARWNLVHAVPFRRRFADVNVGWVASCTDLTERQEREAAMRMTEKLALTGRMTSVIAHEINNPLESITNLMYLLRNELPTEGPALEYVSLAESELLRISGITKQTLRWNRESSSASARHNAREMVDDVMRLFQGKTRNRSVTVHVGIPPELQYTGVHGQVRQVIANLLSNAIDATRVGGNVWIKGSTEIQPQSSEAPAETTYTVLEVTDDGVGMDTATQQQLFKPFFSTKGDLGNGLGLYISHEIIERHHGTLTVTSALGQGTTMRIRLPLL